VPKPLTPPPWSWFTRFLCKLLRIRGDSLSPKLQDGDFVLSSKIPILLKRLQPGDLVVFNQPGYGVLIKQVESISQDGQSLDVRGLHPESADSRAFGPVSRSSLIGKIIYTVKK
jgi:signal peptidase I